MSKSLLFAIIITSAPIYSAFAQDAALSAVHHTTNCDNATVCATMQDGRSVAITQCKARKDGAVRYLYGDCYDED